MSELEPGAGSTPKEVTRRGLFEEAARRARKAVERAVQTQPFEKKEPPVGPSGGEERPSETYREVGAREGEEGGPPKAVEPEEHRRENVLLSSSSLEGVVRKRPEEGSVLARGLRLPGRLWRGQMTRRAFITALVVGTIASIPKWLRFRDRLAEILYQIPLDFFKETGRALGSEQAREEEARERVKLDNLMLLRGPKLIRLTAQVLAERVVEYKLDLDNPSSWPKTDRFKALRRSLEVKADTVGELESTEGISRLITQCYQTSGGYHIDAPQLEALERYFKLPENSGKSGREILTEYLMTQIKTEEHPDWENYTKEDIKMLFAFVERGPNLKQVINEYNKHLGNNAPEIP